MRTKDLGYLLAFTPALLPPAAVAIMPRVSPDLAAWLPLLVIYGVIPLLDMLIGHDSTNPDPGIAERLDHGLVYRLLTWIAVPLWLGLLAWCTWQWIQLPLDLIGRVGWILSVGALGGTLAINLAHELIHKPGRIEPLLGGLLLTSVGYSSFKIEHLRGHHVHVGTPRDASSARLGQSVYGFVLLALVRNPITAWRLETQRLRREGRHAWSLHNEQLRWWLLWAAMIMTVDLAVRPSAALFVLAQGVVAAATLEVINYIEHYGLQRRQLSSGRYERVGHAHAWNASSRLTAWLLYQLPRHADHHLHPRRRYQSLRHAADSPQLPTGYAGMFVLSLVPPLWRRVMDPRVRRHMG